MAGKTGYDAISNTDEFDPPADITAVAKHFDDLIDFTVDDATKLPQSGNWVGRQARALDTRKVYVCTALPSTWVGEEAYATFATKIGGLPPSPDTTYKGAGSIVPVSTQTKNAGFLTQDDNGNITLKAGAYDIEWDAGMGAASAATGRGGFIQIDGPNGRIARGVVPPGEDGTTAHGMAFLTAASPITFQVLKTSATADVTGTLRIFRKG
ncbi:hypothetical protein [Curtobacterium sp. MCBA15_004]|uniref:hypothetical protein n=1 Tax=Curtobacterium sp. MCBA15_004 TaxID=1898733 RepID=UPI0008DE8D1C|nr:hypothetical protein [Curtobacterium sp. MCBA15_004]WIA95794.1 hypothetical protein QOL16_11810 [Curtobacterium sp. MCBA15_004]